MMEKYIIISIVFVGTMNLGTAVMMNILRRTQRRVAYKLFFIACLLKSIVCFTAAFFLDIEVVKIIVLAFMLPVASAMFAMATYTLINVKAEYKKP